MYLGPFGPRSAFLGHFEPRLANLAQKSGVPTQHSKFCEQLFFGKHCSNAQSLAWVQVTSPVIIFVFSLVKDFSSSITLLSIIDGKNQWHTLIDPSFYKDLRLSVNSHEACATLCAEEASCLHWSFNTETQRCILRCRCLWHIEAVKARFHFVKSGKMVRM